jgi:HEAT repeat protein
MLVLSALLVSAPAALACRGQARHTVDRVVVGQTPALQSLESLGISGESLAESASRLLVAAPGFVPAAQAGAGARRFLAQVSVERAEVRAGATVTATSAHVMLAVSLEPLNGGSALRETGHGSAPIAGGPQGLRAALEQATTSALQVVVASFSAQLAAEQKRKSELVKDLGSSQAGVREHAMRVLADRGERDAVPALIARLRDRDPEIRERAVGALAQLRDQRAVGPLIELVHRRDAQYVAQMALIIGDIGGPEARAWLLTMSSGHPDQAVRRAAHEALTEMDARELHAAADGRQGR